ncbi:MAG: hypothetical protein J5804_03560 [Eggerthellaceae bacterium]|nr:hypothetical protein [Eggerthellaceae bacterium]
MTQLISEEVFILYYILPDNRVTIVGTYSSEANARRADLKARTVKPALQEEGVRGPFIGKTTLDDHFMSTDTLFDIQV